MNFGQENIKINPEKKVSILDNLENQLKLTRILGNVYENRPDMKKFIGAMKGTSYESEYTKESISKDEEYVERTRSAIEKDNSSLGEARFNYLEGGFQLSEMLQAMIVDRMNNNWYKDCKSIMTSDFDDLNPETNIDGLLKHNKNGYMGMSFDFTVSSQDKIIDKKLADEWANIKKGKIPVVKYFEDPDTKEKKNLLVPKFIIGASKTDLEELATAYLNNDKETLDNHPLKYLILLQIEEQLQTILDFYEVNSYGETLKSARLQYERIEKILRIMKNEIHLDTNMNVDLHEYSKKSVALDRIRNFRINRNK